MDRFEHGRAGAGRVEVGRRGQADAARHRAAGDGARKAERAQVVDAWKVDVLRTKVANLPDRLPDTVDMETVPKKMRKLYEQIEEAINDDAKIDIVSAGAVPAAGKKGKPAPVAECGLKVNVDEGRVAKIAIPDEDWNGACRINTVFLHDHDQKIAAHL